MRARGKYVESDWAMGEEGWKVSNTEAFPVTRSVAAPPAHRDTGEEGFGGNVACLHSWAAQEGGLVGAAWLGRREDVSGLQEPN